MDPPGKVVVTGSGRGLGLAGAVAQVWPDAFAAVGRRLPEPPR